MPDPLVPARRLQLAGPGQDRPQARDATDAVRDEPHPALGHHADAHRRHARQAERVVAQVVPRDEADLEAAAVAVDVVDERSGEVRAGRLGRDALARGDRLDRVHHVGDVDLLRAADGAEVAGHAHPRRVAAQHLVAQPARTMREQHPRRVVHVGRGRARAAARPALDAGLEAGFTRGRRSDLVNEAVIDGEALLRDPDWR